MAVNERMPLIKFIAEFPAGEAIVSMVVWQGDVILATTRRVFRLVDGGHFEEVPLWSAGPAT